MFRKLVAGAMALAAAFTFAPLASATAEEPLRFAVTDVDGMEALQRDFGPFKEAFEQVSGLKVDFFAVSGRTAAVEAMAAGQVDLVLTGPAEYVVFNARTKAVPVVAWTRPDYFSQIVVLRGSDINSLADLKGKKISFGEIGSTSQHLGPAQILKDAGLNYGDDYEAVFLKLNVAAEALKKGDIAAIGMNLTHLHRVRKNDPTLPLAVIGRGRDLPDDLIIAAPTLAPETLQKVRDAFLNHTDTLMTAVVGQEENAKWKGGLFLPTINDADYDVVRTMYRAVGVSEFSQFLGN